MYPQITSGGWNHISKNQRSQESITIDIEDFIALKGFKALGNQLTTDKSSKSIC
jgi:hypothetical protein